MPLDLLGALEPQVFLAEIVLSLDLQDHLDQEVLLDIQDLLVLLDQLEALVHLDLLDYLEHLVSQAQHFQVCTVILFFKPHKDVNKITTIITLQAQVDPEDFLGLQGTLAETEELVLLVHQELQAFQDLLAFQETLGHLE